MLYTLVLLPKVLGAQDPFFTQVAFLPMHLNPALSGNEGGIRAGAAYRTQWKALGVPFSTRCVSFDAGLGKSEKKGRPDNSPAKGLGIGAFFLNDRGGDPEFTTNQFNASLAYKLQAGAASYFSVGLNTGFDQRSVDVANGQWASQYNGIQFDPGLASGEAFGNDRVGTLHTGAGVSFGWMQNKGSVRSPRHLGIEGGIAAFQLGSVEVIRSPTLQYGFPVRYIAHISARVDIGNDGFGIDPMLYYLQQGPFQMLMSGCYFRYAIIEGNDFASNAQRLDAAVGIFLRNTNALAVSTKLNWGSYGLAISYDMGIGPITNKMPHLGAFELALLWHMP